MPTEFGDGRGVVTGVCGAAANGLVDGSPGQRREAEVAVLRDSPQQRCSGGARHSPATHMSVERFQLTQQADDGRSAAGVEGGEDLHPANAGAGWTGFVRPCVGQGFTAPLPS